MNSPSQDELIELLVTLSQFIPAEESQLCIDTEKVAHDLITLRDATPTGVLGQSELIALAKEVGATHPIRFVVGVGYPHDTQRHSFTDAELLKFAQLLLRREGNNPDTLKEICDLFGIGSEARTHQTIMTNVRNVKRFAAMLHAIEHEFFTDEEGESQLNSWGSTEAEYVEQFRATLAQQPTAPGGESIPQELRHRLLEIHSWRTKGILKGDFLNTFASKQPYFFEDDAMRRAENQTIDELLAIVASAKEPQ
jgi:hypothetical protein